MNNLIFHHISPSWTHFTGRFPILCSALLFRIFRSFGSFRYQMQQLQRSNSLDHAGSVTWKVVPCIWPAQILYYIYGLILSYITWQANSSKPMQVTSIGHQRFSGFVHGMSWSSIWRVESLFVFSLSQRSLLSESRIMSMWSLSTTFEWSLWKNLNLLNFGW